MIACNGRVGRVALSAVSGLRVCRPGHRQAARAPPCPEPRTVLPSTAITRCRPGPGAVRLAADWPARSSNTSASSRCKVRRKVDSEGTAPATPSPRKVSWSASAAHSAIAVNDRAPASTAQTASPKITAAGSARPGGAAGQAGLLQHHRPDQQDGQGQGQSVMMARRAWFLGNDLAGVGTAMIRSRTRAVPSLLSAYHRHATFVTPRTLPTLGEELSRH